MARQTYLDAAPGGIGAVGARTRPGGRGQGVRIIDLEGAWRFSHEDMLQNQGGVIGGTAVNRFSLAQSWNGGRRRDRGGRQQHWRHRHLSGGKPPGHLGLRLRTEFRKGDHRRGQCPESRGYHPDRVHSPGPRFNFAERGDQMGYIGVEFWPADFAAILFATAVRGVIVVQAGGNGAENLDDALYNTRPTGFPTTWTNPFNLSNPQSGAIMVGAGAPPPGTHSQNHGPDRSRLAFSNFGARVDVQGWGEEVTTCGYGDLQGGTNEDIWYTDGFNGTSSASPIVVGALGCLQGGLRVRSRPLLTPATARDILRSTGSPQQDAPGRPATQRIGNRPDLLQAFQSLGLGKGLLKEVKDKEKSEAKDAKDKDKDNVKEIKDKDKYKDKDAKDKDKDKDKETKDKEKAEDKDVKDKDKDKDKDVKETKDSEKSRSQGHHRCVAVAASGCRGPLGTARADSRQPGALHRCRGSSRSPALGPG